MKPVLPLFIFIDACGWEIIREDPFAREFAPFRQRLTSVFGYSSACVPSILSGRWPSEHRNWCYFVYDPPNSPFRSLRWLRWLPEGISSRRRFRRWLSLLVKRQLSFRGYFDLYNMPFKHISLFDFSEKKNPLQPEGMNRGPNIFDYLEEQGIAYHVSDPNRTEEANLVTLRQDIAGERIDFAFLYWPGLDGLLHMVGNKSPQIGPKLRAYEEWIRSLLQVAGTHYADVKLYIFSDHGMANCDEHLDLRARLEALPLRFGEDYVAVYDSTMARFWFLNEKARLAVQSALSEIPEGRIVPDEELQQLGAFFPDRYFGELVFLVREGVLIVPSHMGQRPIRAMHGYHPSDPQSYAVLCANQDRLRPGITHIPHVFELMKSEAERARRARDGTGGTGKSPTRHHASQLEPSAAG